MLIGNDFTSKELTNGSAVCFVVRLVKCSPHRLDPLDDPDVRLTAAPPTDGRPDHVDDESFVHYFNLA